MHRLPPTLAIFCLLALFCAQPVFAAHDFPWITPFEDGRYLGDILPAGVVETNYAAVKSGLAGKEIDLIILDGGGSGFESVSIGYYDNNKRDVTPLWSSELRDDLPYNLKNQSFNELFIKYAYLPGDKYVSCNFKVAVDASFGSEKAKLKAFLAKHDLDYAGVSLKAGDFILAGDSGGGALSNLGNGDYSDLVFVVSIRQEPAISLSYAFFTISGLGFVGVTCWSIQHGKKGLRVFTL